MIDKEIAPRERATVGMRVAVFLTVMLPFLGLICAVVLMWGRGISEVELVLMLGMYTATGMGVTVGFHRLFTHRSFETVGPIRILLAVLGSMAVEGPMLTWVGVHRRHHQHSDQVGDPHSPNHHGGGIWGMARGFLHAHMGWMFLAPPPDMDRNTADLNADPVMRGISRLFVLWVALGLIIPGVIGGLVSRSWTGVWLGMLWGGLVRVFVLHHTTWSINSVCHLWGSRPFEGGDESRNNLVFGILGFGEGWHNNHHAFPASARHGLRWWEFDMSYIFIRLLQMLGLAWRVQLPGEKAIIAKRARPKDEPSALETILADRTTPSV